MILFSVNGICQGVSEEIYCNIRKCIDYVKRNDVSNFEKGKYQIDEDRLFMNIAEYETKEEETCIWEAHRKYLDLHFIISGSEIIKIGNLNEMQIEGYDEEQDYVKVVGRGMADIALTEGSFLLLFPEDVHMTSVKYDKKAKIKKAIFKILIEK